MKRWLTNSFVSYRVFLGYLMYIGHSAFVMAMSYAVAFPHCSLLACNKIFKHLTNIRLQQSKDSHLSQDCFAAFIYLVPMLETVHCEITSDRAGPMDGRWRNFDTEMSESDGEIQSVSIKCWEWTCYMLRGTWAVIRDQCPSNIW